MMQPKKKQEEKEKKLPTISILFVPPPSISLSLSSLFVLAHSFCPLLTLDEMDGVPVKRDTPKNEFKFETHGRKGKTPDLTFVSPDEEKGSST